MLRRDGPMLFKNARIRHPSGIDPIRLVLCGDDKAYAL